MINRKIPITAALVGLLSLVGMAQSKPEQLVGEGTIVAFQKYDRHREKPYQRGMGTFVEEWIVRIDKWENGTKSLLLAERKPLSVLLAMMRSIGASGVSRFESQSFMKRNLAREMLLFHQKRGLPISPEPQQ